MSFEAQEYKDLGRDIYAEVRDGDLSEQEREDLLSRYQEECSQVTAETCENLQELRDAMDIFEESINLEREDIRKIQKIISTWSDGVFGPGSFLQFESYKHETSFEWWLADILTLYLSTQEYFEGLSQEERKNLQAPWGRDGVFGPNTFRNMLINQSIPSDLLGREIQRDYGIQTPIVEEEQVVIAPRIPGDHHPEVRQLLSEEQKTELFMEQSSLYHDSLIRELQRDLWFEGRQVDGDYGPMSVGRTLEQYPNAQSLEEVFVQAWINTDIDGPLIGENATLEEARDNFRNLYGELVNTLSDNLSLPEWFMEAIIRAETTYWKNLQSGTGSKGLMQLTVSPFDDMAHDRHRHAIYAPLFHSLNMEEILQIQIGESSVREKIPDTIIHTLLQLNDPNTSLSDFQSGIRVLREHIKGRNAGFDHETNLIIGAVYLAYQTNRHNGNIYRAARDYNWESNGWNIRYAKNVRNYRQQIISENN